MAVVPYKDATDSKKDQVANMFDNISHKYDFLNHFLSMGIDVIWRKKSLKLLAKEPHDTVLDIATGTGDFAIQAMPILQPKQITGVDISKGMLAKGEEKIKKRGLEDAISLQVGDSEDLPFDEHSFDVVMVAYGVRNFEHLKKGLAEMHRVLKPNGTVLIVEFSKPKAFPMKQLFNFYFKNILPAIGRLVSKDKSAYTYLPESVQAFPDGQDFLDILKEVGFDKPLQKNLTFGVCSIYKAKKY